MALDYGLDAPRDVRKFTVRGGLLVGLGLVMAVTNQGFSNPLVTISVVIGGGFLLTAAVMVWSSRSAKLGMRDRILAELPWRGDEQVLDVGCGRGLFLIGAAKRLTSGKATGVDVWREQDQSGNTSEAALENAKAEGVRGKIRIEDADATNLPFKDASFDTVLSSLAIHNIADEHNRRVALAEMVRVLKPGGHVAILDILRTGQYARELASMGLVDVKLSGISLLWCLPTRYLIAKKPS